MSYVAWKLVHIVGVVMFLGNITTGLFWAAHAHRQHDFRTIASTFDGIIRSDRWFTVPGVVAILAGGFVMAINGGFPLLGTGWIFWPLVLFSVSGAGFAIWVAPLQKKIRALVSTTSQTDESWREYHALYKRWERWGFIAWVAPVFALIIMILKPAIPGL